MTSRPASSASTRDPFAALGDHHRRTILLALSHGDLSVQEIADDLPISRPAVSRHLRLLRQAGLVSYQADGTRRVYRLDGRGVEAVDRYLRAVWGEALARFRIAAENLRDES